MSNGDPTSGRGAQDWPPPPAHPLQAIDRFVRSAQQLARALRWIAWVELVVSIVLGLTSFVNSLANFSVNFGVGYLFFMGLLVAVLQAFVFWGLLLGMALLLENQSSRHE